jgi:predicted PolB exonuclease-like 3'-5' exonuclease
MAKAENISNFLFVDIETVSQYPSYDEVPEDIKLLWDKKSSYTLKDGETSAEAYKRAGIWAEFGKIICISCGYIPDSSRDSIRIRSFAGDDEKVILADFVASMTKFFQIKQNAKLCAHNGKEFDFPYIARRLLINMMTLPPMLDVGGKKPWEVPFLDTLELWKFGDYKHYCSLPLLTTILNIPTPKDDIDGSMVADVYYKEKDLQRIVKYCEKDVLAVARLMQRYRNEPLVEKFI